jgi:hypothetical protein
MNTSWIDGPIDRGEATQRGLRECDPIHERFLTLEIRYPTERIVRASRTPRRKTPERERALGFHGVHDSPARRRAVEPCGRIPENVRDPNVSANARWWYSNNHSSRFENRKQVPRSLVWEAYPPTGECNETKEGPMISDDTSSSLSPDDVDSFQQAHRQRRQTRVWTWHHAYLSRWVPKVRRTSSAPT